MKKMLLFLIFTGTFCVSSAQLQNLNFENWEDGNRLEYWHNQYPLHDPILPGTSFTFPPETDAQNLNYALRLSIWYFYVKDVAIQRAPINYQPEYLEGYYKYEHNIAYLDEDELVTDTASVRVYLTKWNTNTLQRDTIGTGINDFWVEKTNYTHFTNTINYTSNQVPDSITVVLDPSRLPQVSNMWGEVGETSFFTIDNLFLAAENLSVNTTQLPKVNVYPNPATNNINITNFTGTATLYNTQGKLLLAEKEITNTNHTITLTGFTRGVYILKLVSNGSIIHKKIIKE